MALAPVGTPSSLPALAFALGEFALAEILAVLESHRVGPRAPAILLAIGEGAAATGFFAFSGDTLVDVIERHCRDCHDEQRAEQPQAPLRMSRGMSPSRHHHCIGKIRGMRAIRSARAGEAAGESMPRLAPTMTTPGHAFGVSRVAGPQDCSMRSA